MTTPDEDLIKEARAGLLVRKGGTNVTKDLADALERSNARWEKMREFFQEHKESGPVLYDPEATKRLSAGYWVIDTMDAIEAKYSAEAKES